MLPPRCARPARSCARPRAGRATAYDRANKGFSYYLRGVEVLEHTPSGRRGNFDRADADAVVTADCLSRRGTRGTQ